MHRLVFGVALVAGCAISGPFEGPGYDGETVTTDASGPYLAVATYAKMASGQRKAFGAHVDAVEAQLKSFDGLVGYSLRGEIPGKEVWTVTVWEDEAALLEFVTSGAHQVAMADATTVVAEFDSAHFEVSADRLPPAWSDILDALDEATGPSSY